MPGGRDGFPRKGSQVCAALILPEVLLQVVFVEEGEVGSILWHHCSHTNRAALPSLWGRRGHLLCRQGGFTSVGWEGGPGKAKPH